MPDAHTALARRLQYAIAAVFIILGGWCLAAPTSVIAMTVRPDFHTEASLAVVALGAFGAQAMLAGLFAGFSIFTRWTFFAYGIALLPFFVFDWWFFFVTPMFNEFILLDAAGNVVMLCLCAYGYTLLSKTQAA
ncbi:hypothetical protein ACFOOP_05720 [Marinicaulis aureus]|uniref:Lipoprotein n=1 Tax=Hyphococcus aureus TaxID=2666033 RepID=A0ABW1KVV5_9PROT